ncbi:GMP synthase subunit B [Novipirellula galeiformis]|uniref:GMP synthase subunit B n=1 Tax=Novipirellula galeiformis TaxID=2528004 RepID=A0A5C6CI92_9BACT|nr:ATP-dependent sacrificial sulfur transferase LarE [Novipirellula galeiformis]TWU24148.1 GMP synthase subunit B [Novipirellula galeiformis]
MHNVSTNAARLIERIASFRRVTVAFSGGVDSSVVAAAATRAKLDALVAVTADSPSVPRWQLQWATRIANQIGIAQRVVPTHEGDREEYVRNDTKRCFYCKETLYRTLGQLANHDPTTVLVSGTNADDLGDYRPGIEAGKNASVQTPLADLRLGKQEVRELARFFGLENADLPASPCLASRVAYGVEVTPERLSRIEQAETWLREQGFSDGRVRVHHDELARVEVPSDELPRLLSPPLASELNESLRAIGFRFVTVDLQGLESGSMNRVLVQIGEAQH